jgi:hypothetical protein
MPGDFRCDRCEYSCAFSLLPSRTRGCGCIGHPAFPRALCFRGATLRQQLGRIAPRGREVMSVKHRPCEKSMTCVCCEMDCFAEPVIGRRVAPTRWLAMTVREARATLSPSLRGALATKQSRGLRGIARWIASLCNDGARQRVRRMPTGPRKRGPGGLQSALRVLMHRLRQLHGIAFMESIVQTFSAWLERSAMPGWNS